MSQQTIKMYGAPWCPDCRRAKQFFGDQRVLYDWINVDDNPDSMKYVEQVNGGKQIISAIVFENGSVLVEPTTAELAEKLSIRPKATRQYFEVIIIGFGPAGLTAAIYATREGFDTLVIERSGAGGQAGVTERINNYPGFPDDVGGAELADQIRTHVERFGVEILPAQAVSKITSMGDYRLVTTEAGDEYCASAIIVATGSRYRRLNVPGEDNLIGAQASTSALHATARSIQGSRGRRRGGRQLRHREEPVPDQICQQCHSARVRRPTSRQPSPAEDGREEP